MVVASWKEPIPGKLLSFSKGKLEYLLHSSFMLSSFSNGKLEYLLHSSLTSMQNVELAHRLGGEPERPNRNSSCQRERGDENYVGQVSSGFTNFYKRWVSHSRDMILLSNKPFAIFVICTK